MNLHSGRKLADVRKKMAAIVWHAGGVTGFNLRFEMFLLKNQHQTGLTPKADHFTPTKWRVVLEAGPTDYGRAAAALERRCRKYGHPVDAFFRRRGSDRHDAGDLTPAFFTHLLEKEPLKKVNRQKGRFRSFLLAAATDFPTGEWDKRQTLKRGGQNQVVALDEMAAEELYSPARRAIVGKATWPG